MEDSQVVTNNNNQFDAESTPSMNNVYSSNLDDEQDKTVVDIPALPSKTEADPTIQLLLKEMYLLRQDFDTKVKYDEGKERMIESLHRELQTYREGLHFRLLRPMFTDLITLYDEIGKLIDNTARESNGNVEQLVNNLIVFQETIEETLSSHGVDSFSVEGMTFISNRQRILKVIPAFDPAWDRQIFRRVRKGFIYGDIVLRPEVVEIYKYIPATSQ